MSGSGDVLFDIPTVSVEVHDDAAALHKTE